MNQILFWAAPASGTIQGNIRCGNGVVYLVGIPEDQQEKYLVIVQEFSNTLDRNPGTVEEATAYLTERGLPRVEHGAWVAFGPLPESEAVPADSEPPATDAGGRAGLGEGDTTKVDVPLIDLLAKAKELGIDRPFVNRADLEGAVAKATQGGPKK